eukprot:8407159-Pyramimonas_sp.AAC.1
MCREAVCTAGAGLPALERWRSAWSFPVFALRGFRAADLRAGKLQQPRVAGLRIGRPPACPKWRGIAWA